MHLILLLLLFLGGCGQSPVYPKDFKQAIELCEANQGLKHIEVVDTAYKVMNVTCNNGATFHIRRNQHK